jgi:LAO/AO transport system kinase
LNTSRLQVDEYKKGILEGDRVVLAKAITLIESTLPDDQRITGEVLDAVISRSGNSLRIGITGAPGVGKSSFIESFGKTLIQSGKKVAVLAVDPSSRITHGSILGDKTRMQELARHPGAFIRPSASGLASGGVGSHTREAILLCEAAGFDMVIVETVGTGQSETAIKTMVDFFLLLMQPGSGDELQGIKKGIVEMADAIAVTKADGDNLKAARATQADFQHALHLLKLQPHGWTPKVMLCSALQNTGLDEIRDMIEDFRKHATSTGYLEANRKSQHVTWFNEYFNFLLAIDPKRFPAVDEAESKLTALIQSKNISPRQAATELLRTYHAAVKNTKGAAD